jgi:hypothetical protein
LVSVSMHDPPQFSRPVGHVVAHRPLSQTPPAAHAWLQPPQWTGLDFVSTHASPQRANPSRQLKPHSPSLQLAVPFAGASHATPHAPQLTGSPIVSTQFASSQAENPASHSMEQAPSPQTPRPFKGIRHAASQAPQ